MTSIHELHQIAHDMGITLTHHTHGPPGFYIDEYRVISTRKGMAVWDYKSVLAHELGHAHHKDRRSGHKHFDDRQEKRADEYAARLLICPHRLRHLAPWHRHDRHSLAIDLEVTPKLLETYLKMYPNVLKGLAA
ncbi:ImmA/IrrE family metallo-endopeptidase [Corynebacterium auriscanis]|uniref:ImmA/IrrE family metallo-endopeptidase n=1 Tax=Corynebacterium auriscanis TaxID=99807 RepID=UPI003CF19633